MYHIQYLPNSLYKVVCLCNILKVCCDIIHQGQNLMQVYIYFWLLATSICKHGRPSVKSGSGRTFLSLYWLSVWSNKVKKKLPFHFPQLFDSTQNGTNLNALKVYDLLFNTVESMWMLSVLKPGHLSSYKLRTGLDQYGFKKKNLATMSTGVV